MEVPVYHLESVVKTRTEPADFDGPLDLILALLSKNKMEIQDIQIALILDQYLAWMEQRKEMDLEIASEFVTMAAQLVYIKTRMLLSINDEEALSEMEELIASLEERQRHENFKKIRAIVPGMLSRYEVGRDCITRMQEPITPDRTYRYVHQPADLQNAILGVLRRSGEQPQNPEKAFQFLGSKTRSEVVATFLAILELCKASRIRLAGTEQDCTVTQTEGAEATEHSEEPETTA